MKIIRHTARDMRQALRAVREQLGEDAVILSSRRTGDGVEVTAAVDFDASTLAFTSVDVGNDATNVIPREARAAFNIRFNDKHTPDSLANWVKDRAAQITQQSGCTIDVAAQTSGVSFLTAPGKFTQLISDTVAGITGQVFGARQNELYLYNQPRQVRSVHREAGWSVQDIHQHAMPAMRQFLTSLDDSSQVIGWDPI